MTNGKGNPPEVDSPSIIPGLSLQAPIYRGEAIHLPEQRRIASSSAYGEIPRNDNNNCPFPLTKGFETIFLFF